MKREQGEFRGGGDLGGWDSDRLALAAKSGDREARNALFSQHEGMMKRRAMTVRRMLGTLALEQTSLEAEDIEQQLFLIFCDLLADWQPGQTPFTPFLIKVVPWRVLHYLRGALGYRSTAKVGPFHPVIQGEYAGADPEGGYRFQRVENEAALERHVESLDDKWKMAINLKFYEGMSSREIASVSGRSRRTVDRELRAAISAMREKVQEEWEGCG